MTRSMVPQRSKMAFFAGLAVMLGCVGPPSRALYEPPDGYAQNEDRGLKMHVRSWVSLRQDSIVMQETDYSCGAAAVATIVRYYWGDMVDENDFLELILESLDKQELEERVQNGLSMADLRLAAVEAGYLSTVGERTLEQLQEIKIPVVIRIETDGYEHFVVLRGIVGGEAYLADPIRGNLRVPLDQFVQQWTDGAVLVVVKPDTDPPKFTRLTVTRGDTARPESRSIIRSLYLIP